MAVLNLVTIKGMYGKQCEKLYVWHKKERIFRLRSLCLLHHLTAGTVKGYRNFEKNFKLSLFCKGVSDKLKVLTREKAPDDIFSNYFACASTCAMYCARPENHGLAAKARSSMRNNGAILMCLEKFSKFSFVLQYGKCPTLI